MTSVAVGGTMGLATIGAVPNISGSSAATGMKAGFATGVSNVGTALPVMGKVKGASMVLGSVHGLSKAGKKFTTKKKRRRK